VRMQTPRFKKAAPPQGPQGHSENARTLCLVRAQWFMCQLQKCKAAILILSGNTHSVPSSPLMPFLSPADLPWLLCVLRHMRLPV
jgi:hypothetical protein